MDDADVVAGVFDLVAGAAPEIRSKLPERRTTMDRRNPSGEAQLHADVVADGLLCDGLDDLDGVGEYASEERADVVDVGGGDLTVAVDPLDGSSNLRPNNTMGTVVAVYDEPLPAPGTSIVAAGYVLYGPLTTMVVARDGRVTEYLVEEGDRTLLREDVRLPEDPTVYGFGGRVPDWFPEFEGYVRSVERDSSLKLRYGGSMIGDVNQVLTYGGVFAYPALQSAPRGKLRLQFEGNPVAHILETAGGASSDGHGSILEVEPAEIHDRVPVHVGNQDLIARLETALATD
jgi:fructose-1,6-bisphosphatase I